uniref:Uncharacterized protein n=1 Tax=Lepeophtheirus salmonis TaxID=72036 RepID=A0A0K2TLN9_LEPSM
MEFQGQVVVVGRGRRSRRRNTREKHQRKGNEEGMI